MGPPPPVPVEEIDSTRADLIVNAMGEEGDLVATRLARSCRCFAVFLDGAVAGYGWLSTTPEWIGELELEIAPGQREGYIWNCVTLPEHRRKGVFRALIAGIGAAGRAGGLRRMWIGSVAIPAEKAVGPSGFKPALVFGSVRLAGYHWLRVQPAPGADPALVAAAHQVMGIPAGRFLRAPRPRRH